MTQTQPTAANVTRINVVLAHEELVYMLALLKLPGLPGLPANPLPDADETTYNRLMGAAERSLRAKSVIRPEDGNLAVDSLIGGIIAFCARDTRSLLFSRREIGVAGDTADSAQAAPPRAVVYHFSDLLKVKHYAVEGLHTFALFTNETAALDDVMLELSGRMEGDAAARDGSDANDAMPLGEITSDLLVAVVGETQRERRAGGGESSFVQMARRYLPAAYGEFLDRVAALPDDHLIALNIIGSWNVETVETPFSTAILQFGSYWWLAEPATPTQPPPQPSPAGAADGATAPNPGDERFGVEALTTSALRERMAARLRPYFDAPT